MSKQMIEFYERQLALTAKQLQLVVLLVAGLKSQVRNLKTGLALQKSIPTTSTPEKNSAMKVPMSISRNPRSKENYSVLTRILKAKLKKSQAPLDEVFKLYCQSVEVAQGFGYHQFCYYLKVLGFSLNVRKNLIFPREKAGVSRGQYKPRTNRFKALSVFQSLGSGKVHSIKEIFARAYKLRLLKNENEAVRFYEYLVRHSNDCLAKNLLFRYHRRTQLYSLTPLAKKILKNLPISSGHNPR